MPKPRFSRLKVQSFQASMDAVLTIEEVCSMCNISRSGVMYLIFAGQIYAQKRGKTWLVSRASLHGALGIVNELPPRADNYPIYWQDDEEDLK